MLINKITVGFVVQAFDTDKQEFIHQEFVAGDDVTYETSDGDGINEIDFVNRVVGSEPYLPFHMKQPVVGGHPRYCQCEDCDEELNK